MTNHLPPTWDRPDLDAVPLFTAFGDVATDPGRPGRVRSGFTLPAAGGGPTPTPASLHVVGRQSPSRTAPRATAPSSEVDWDEASELRARASKLTGNSGSNPRSAP